MKKLLAMVLLIAVMVSGVAFAMTSWRLPAPICV